MSTAATKNAAQQVSHWVHDEVSCVTVQRIVQTFHLSWSASLSLLKEIPQGGKEYSVTVLSSGSNSNDSNNSEVIRLVSSKFDDDTKPEDSATWYALALTSCNESVQAACERDRAQFHETMAEFTLDHDSSDFLAVPEPMKRRIELNQGKRTATDAFDDDPKPRKSTKSAPIVAKKISSTTAKDFFGASNSKGKSANNKTTTAATTKSSSSSKSNNKNTMAKSKQSSSSFFQPKKGGGTSQQKASSAKAAPKKSGDEEKENVHNKSSSEVGNADDFVGDIDDEEDDDDDDDVEEAEEEPVAQKPKAAKRGARKREEEPVEMLSDDEDQEEEPEEKADKKVNDGPKPRRRKKVMEEKNFTDENGYFYTKTVAVWKEVESDEEEKFPVKSKAFNQQPKGNNTKGKKKAAPRPNAMKQSTLKGFFTKKK